MYGRLFTLKSDSFMLTLLKLLRWVFSVFDMREIVQLAVIIAIVITKGRFIAGALSEAPQRSKMGNLSMRENLVMTSAYARQYVRTGRKVLSGLWWVGLGNPRHVACGCIGETLASSPRGNQMRGKCSINTTQWKWKRYLRVNRTTHGYVRSSNVRLSVVRKCGEFAKLIL